MRQLPLRATWGALLSKNKRIQFEHTVPEDCCCFLTYL
uniref:Uncharacterized protein n=1 Tax=Anguilla anguilla TaxID=7936 RepID=A0A0E9W792_ANGAN